MPLHVGNLLVALSVATLFGVAPRLLEDASFVELAASWTITAIFGYGLALPTEQALTRRGSAGHVSTRPPAFLVCLGIVTVAVTIGLGFSWLPVVGAMLGIFGWVLLAPSRGQLAGSGAFASYGALLSIEAATRLLLIAIAVGTSARRSLLLDAAVGLPLLVAGVAGVARRRRRGQSQAVTASSGIPRHELAAFVGVAASYQVVLNSAPVIFAATLGVSDAGTVASFAVANAVFRSPSIVAAGFITHSLATLSAAWSVGNDELFKRALWSATHRAVLSAGAAALILLAIGPGVVTFLLGRPSNLPLAALCALSVSTTFAVGSIVLTTAHFAARRPLRALSAWAPGSLIVIGGVLWGHGVGLASMTALVIGPLVVGTSAYMTLPEVARGVKSRQRSRSISTSEREP